MSEMALKEMKDIVRQAIRIIHALAPHLADSNDPFSEGLFYEVCRELGYTNREVSELLTLFLENEVVCRAGWEAYRLVVPFPRWPAPGELTLNTTAHRSDKMFNTLERALSTHDGPMTEWQIRQFCAQAGYVGTQIDEILSVLMNHHRVLKETEQRGTYAFVGPIPHSPQVIILGDTALDLAQTTWVRDDYGRPVGELRMKDRGKDITTYLRYEEVCKLAAQARDVRTQLEWAMATWVSVSVAGTPTYHLARKGEHKGSAPALCGYHPAEPWSWTYAEPLMGEPGTLHTCKRCLSRYRAIQASSAT